MTCCSPGSEPDRRAAFVLTQMIGCSYAEAAAICDCPVGTIRSRVARAREDLIAMMADPDAGPRRPEAAAARAAARERRAGRRPACRRRDRPLSVNTPGRYYRDTPPGFSEIP